MKPLRILLVSMPWRDHRTPNPGLGILKAILREAGHECDVLEGSLYMAADLGVDYTRVYEAGEFIEIAFAPFVYDGYPLERARAALAREFARRAEDSRLFSVEQLHEHGVGPSEEETAEFDALVERLPSAAGDLIDRLEEEVDWSEYDVVGFSCTFNQTLASAALARRIRERWPRVRLVVGGAACEGPMAEALMSVFPFYDAAASGRAEGIAVEFFEGVAAGASLEGLGGVVHRRADGLHVSDAPAPRIPLDGLPVADYAHYQPLARELGVVVPRIVPMEASVGCWWGQKNLCTFCGLNATSLNFLHKSSERTLHEIREFARRYGTERINFTDNILPLSYYDTLVPRLIELAEQGERYTFFVEIKTNVARDQLEALRDAGFSFMQPGIESLSTHVLRLMKKGNTGISQIQYLKWSAEFAQDLAYNILVATPGELVDDYDQMTAVIPGLVHLQPPSHLGEVRLQRFSPYFDDPERWGIHSVQPDPLYRDVFPDVPDEVMRRLVYTFTFEHDDLHEPSLVEARRRLHHAVARWQAVHRRGLCTYTFGEGWVSIDDQREGAWMGTDARETIVLEGTDAVIYRAFDRVRSIASAATELGLPAPQIRATMEALERRRLVCADGPRWVALATRVPRVGPRRRVEPRWDLEAPKGVDWSETCPTDVEAAINAACAST